MSARRPRRGQAGMTLIEVIIALGILTLMLSLAWSTTSTTSRVKLSFEELQARSAEIRVGTARMVQDLQGAYLSNNEDTSWTDRRTRFIGKDEELEFTSLGHTSLWANAPESEQTMIRYYLDSDREDSTMTDLYRFEARRLTNEAGAKPAGQIDILVRDVEGVRFQYWDWKDEDWKETWNSSQQDGQPGRLPSRVRITLEVAADATDPASETIEYVTQGRVMMQERVNFFIAE
jgi:general secretion pathway protein J